MGRMNTFVDLFFHVLLLLALLSACLLIADLRDMTRH